MLIEVVADKIATEISGLVVGDNLYLNFYPDDPDNIVSIIDLGGNPPNKYTPIREKAIEIKWRNQNYSYGFEQGNQIFKLFHAFENYQLGDFFILSSYANTEVSYLYQDSTNRKEFTFTLVFMYRD
ncbi:minor capsid protein [Gracilibacillus saliphilus]|uniref:minor capsid protein n=1 Tax=Gracilibacillus saliphilus TaxID=543890 RepID=UPI0013D30BA0|nr:minor capsid protein [Gracilibacillus saliphilus]